MSRRRSAARRRSYGPRQRELKRRPMPTEAMDVRPETLFPPFGGEAMDRGDQRPFGSQAGPPGGAS